MKTNDYAGVIKCVLSKNTLASKPRSIKLVIKEVGWEREREDVETLRLGSEPASGPKILWTLAKWALRAPLFHDFLTSYKVCRLKIFRLPHQNDASNSHSCTTWITYQQTNSYSTENISHILQPCTLWSTSAALEILVPFSETWQVMKILFPALCVGMADVARILSLVLCIFRESRVWRISTRVWGIVETSSSLLALANSPPRRSTTEQSSKLGASLFCASSKHIYSCQPSDVSHQLFFVHLHIKLQGCLQANSAQPRRSHQV